MHDNIKLDNNSIKNSESFKYLGSLLTADERLDGEVKLRLKSASAAFAQFRRCVFSNRDIKLSTKIRVYQTLVLSRLLYGAETWTLPERLLRRLEVFHRQCLRSLLRISMRDHITNEEVYTRSGAPSISRLIAVKRLKWVFKTNTSMQQAVPRSLLYGKITNSFLQCGRPQKNFNFTLKKAIPRFDLAIIKKCHDKYQNQHIARLNYRKSQQISNCTQNQNDTSSLGRNVGDRSIDQY